MQTARKGFGWRQNHLNKNKNTFLNKEQNITVVEFHTSFGKSSNTRFSFYYQSIRKCCLVELRAQSPDMVKLRSKVVGKSKPFDFGKNSNEDWRPLLFEITGDFACENLHSYEWNRNVCWVQKTVWDKNILGLTLNDKLGFKMYTEILLAV